MATRSTDPDALTNMGAHIDKAARRAVLSGQPADIERFEGLCQLCADLKLSGLGNCYAVLELAKGR